MSTELETIMAETESLKAKVKALETEKEELVAKGYTPTGSRSYSDEQRALRYFGKSHPKELLAVNVAHPDFARVPDELKHVVLTFKKSVDISRMISQMFAGQPLDRIGGKEEQNDAVSHVKGMLDHSFGKEVLAPMVKAFGTTVVGGGAEWIPTAISSAYIEEYELEKIIEQRLQQVTMPTSTFVLPKVKDVTKARKAGEGAQMTAANYGTDKVTLSAVKLAEYYELPEEMDEDSAPSFLASARSEVVLSQKRAAEAALINGATGVHIDSDTAALGADVAEKIWNGFRKLALANSANGATYDFLNAAATEALLQVLRARMGKFGVSPRQLMWVVGPVVYQQMLGLPNVATVDKFGPMATVLQGALAAYCGIPITISEYMREDLNDAGVYDGVTKTRAGILLVNTTRSYVGTRRPIQVKLMQDLPSYDRWLLASYRRVAFSAHAQSATEKSVVYGLNVAV
jgi:hypothetical protein